MANARINLKTIDYYKFRKLIIDGNRDEYPSCSKEVKTLCDNVQTFNFRDDEFDEQADRGRFDEICCYYRQILNGKRINPIDMRIKSGWWGDQKGSAYAIGKIKPSILKEVLLTKTSEWAKRNGYTDKQISLLSKKIDGPGIFVFKHRERQCFQYVGRANKIFANCAEKLKLAYEGKSLEPLAALFLITLASDWEFYFQPVLPNDEERLLRILENDIILRHDCIWPHGLNFKLQIESLLEVSEFRKSCLRYHWPPPGDEVEPAINLPNLREQVVELKQREKLELETAPLVTMSTSSANSSRRSSVTEVDDAAFQELPPSPTQPFPDPTDCAGERPASPLSVLSTGTYTVDSLERKSATNSIKKTQPRVTPKMGLRKGKENVRKKLLNAGTPSKSKSPKPERKPGLMDYPIDESIGVEADNLKTPEGGQDEQDNNGNDEDMLNKVERPTALPIRSPRQPATSSPKKSRIMNSMRKD